MGVNSKIPGQGGAPLHLSLVLLGQLNQKIEHKNETKQLYFRANFL
jgi:hypothetical protein